MKKTILLVAALILVACAAPAQTTTRLSASKANEYGLVYSLPQTVVDITLEATCTVSTPGEFYNYAERYLGAAEARRAVREASTRWELTSVTMNSRGRIPTDAETWLMQFKGGTPVFVELNANGIPLAINAEPAAEEPAPATPEAKTLTPSPLENEAARHAITEDMLQSSSLAKRAQLAADQIMQLRQSRQDYLTGQAETMPDGKALELILSNIDAQEAALTAMFIGTVQTRTSVTTLTYTPGDRSVANEVIARLNPIKGFVAPDNLSGVPIYLDYKVTDRGQMPKNDKGEQKKFPKGGVAYCIPGRASFTVDFGRKSFPATSFEIAQLGIVYGLAPDFFTNKKEPGYVIFNPSTGGILELGNH